VRLSQGRGLGAAIDRLAQAVRGQGRVWPSAVRVISLTVSQITSGQDADHAQASLTQAKEAPMAELNGFLAHPAWGQT
jgi:hypothetical protein